MKLMKTKLSYHKHNIIAILALVFGCFAGSAQITTQPDKGYTFKNTCVDFYPANNDSLAFPITYKAFVSVAALHGTLTIDSTMPFKATYCPFANYLGKDTMYYRICDNSQTICGISSIIFNIENQSISNIWPGDFNHDGAVNSFDLLFLANSMNTQGSPAFNRTNNWAPSFCDDWNINTWGINNKYIDADGNGMIDMNDITIFQSNIDKTRTSFYQTNNFNPYKTNTYMPLSTKVRKFNLAKGDTIEVDLLFGDTSGLLDIQKIITGFSCLLTIDSAFSFVFKNANAWFESNNNWITKGLGANKISFVSKKTNRLAFDLGFSRTDHYLNKTNYGAGCNQLTLMITTKDKTSNTDLAEIYTSVSGGASPYNYFWSNGATVSTISGLNISNPTSNTETL